MLSKTLSKIDGRTFVVGDIHGCYSLLQRFLDYIKFDFQKDRLISVGDIIDRGPQNDECLDLFFEPWFHSVIGNHEELMQLASFGSDYLWKSNGGDWGLKHLTDFSNEKFHSVISKIPDLPQVLTVECESKKFHVLHAEFGLGKQKLTDSDLQDHKKLDKIAHQFHIEGPKLQWCRHLFGWLYYSHLDTRTLKKYKGYLRSSNADKFFSENLSHIYSGHTILQNPVTVKGQTCLDTGAYLGNRYDWSGLTFTEPETNSFWKVNSFGVHEIKECRIESH